MTAIQRPRNEKTTISKLFQNGIRRIAIKPTVLTSVSHAVAIDLDATRLFKLTLSENSTLSAPTNATEGQSGVIVVTQGAGGSHTLAYNAFWQFNAGARTA